MKRCFKLKDNEDHDLLLQKRIIIKRIYYKLF